MVRRLVGLVALAALTCSCGGDSPTTTPAAGGGAAGSTSAGSGGAPATAGQSSGAVAGGGLSAGGAGGAGGLASGGAVAGGGAAAGSGGRGGVGGSAAGQGGSGGEPAELVIASGQKAPIGIALDSQSVYWTNRDAGSIVKCPLSGCGDKEPTVLASNVGTPMGLALDDKNFYWMSPSTDMSSMQAQVLHCPLSGCTGVPEKLLELSGAVAAVGVHVVDGTLYYAAWPHLGSCPTSGCMEGPTELPHMPALALDSAQSTLFVGRSNGVISCTLPMCADSVNLIKGVQALGIAVDSSHVYFATHDYFVNDATIVPAIERCPLAGCGDNPPEMVKTGGIVPFELALTADRLFYTDVAAGTVVSLAKPK
jgi:hypothetical protein